MRKRAITLLVIIPLILLMGLVLPTPRAAHAANELLVCGGDQETSYTPGLTLLPSTQQVDATFTYTPCVSQSQPAVLSGTSTLSVTRKLSCLTALSSVDDRTRTITWNTGESSVFTYTNTITIVAGETVLTNTGTITSGLFAGSDVIEVVTGPSIDILDCLSGFTHRSATIELTIF